MGTSSALFGSREHTSVARGICEFHGRRPLLISAPGETVLVLPTEGLDEQRLAEFRSLCTPDQPRLIITERRALALGLDASSPMALSLSADESANTILALAAAAKNDRVPVAEPARHAAAAAAAVQLAKMAQSLPSVLAADVSNDAIAREADVIQLQADAVARFADAASDSLVVESEAHLPLRSGTPARFVVFRDVMGGSPVAIIVGNPNLSTIVPVRVHSACLTGDVFGSRRCDCGDQLRLALAAIDKFGGGIILYLPQEGRGIGLANKMRTYRLQDAGFDTWDANTLLGFDDDERDYGIAASMLRMLNCTRIVLLTSNPAKLDGLASAGIEIAGRTPLDAPIKAENRRYMTAKAARSGHRVEHIGAPQVDPP